jgi:uncharacterized protein
MHQHALLIFAKNPVNGKVKTRLAASIGDEEAFSVYEQLLKHTKAVTKNLPVDKIVFYSEHADERDLWDNDSYSKQVQLGNDLGARMKNAFIFAFDHAYSKAVVIGTDCPALNEQLIDDAFNRLEEADVVIGPAFDGGYYLLGIKQVYSFLFENMQWSTTGLLSETINRCRYNQLSFSLLKKLHDVDEEKDLVYLKTIKA